MSATEIPGTLAHLLERPLYGTLAVFSTQSPAAAA